MATILPSHAATPDPRPGVTALFSEIGIQAQGRKKQFIVADNVDGYFDGQTGSYRANAGYWIGQERLFQDHAAWVNGRLIDRRAARSVETVFPYGREVHAVGGSDVFVLHPGSRRFSLRVSSAKNATLAIQPLWKDVPAETRWHDGVLLVTAAAGKLFAAISADQAFEIAAPGTTLAEGMPLLKARDRGKQFTLHLAFSTSADQAVDLARAMAVASSDLLQSSLNVWHERLTRSWLASPDKDYNRALVWAKASALGFLVNEWGRGLWAGLPWYRENWGRDTFISLPGTLLVTGHFTEAREVLENFAKYQNLNTPPNIATTVDPVKGARASDFGRIPNRVQGENIIYNTVDGTPWMLREALEYVRYSGDREFAARALQLAGPYIDGALQHSVDADGLLAHDDADTWMDARIEGQQPWSARGPYAVEIQALWFTALQAAAELAELTGQSALAAPWRMQAERTRASFLRRFWDGRQMADRLRPDGSRDLKVRPNQLMLVSVPLHGFVPTQVEATITRNAVSELLFPYGITSLSPQSEYFHPHRRDDANHHFDASYHNGTIWGWNAGFAVTALNKFGQQDLAWRLSRNLADQILGLGTLGTMSELLDALPNAKGNLVADGTFSQNWSVAEFERNAFQDYLGFRPDLLRDQLLFSPALPSSWKHVDAVLPFGNGEQLIVKVRGTGSQTWHWTLKLQGGTQSRTLVFDALDMKGARQRLDFVLRPSQSATLLLDGRYAWLDGRRLKTTTVMASEQPQLQGLTFATPPGNGDFPMLRSNNVLQDIILRGDFR